MKRSTEILIWVDCLTEMFLLFNRIVYRVTEMWILFNRTVITFERLTKMFIFVKCLFEPTEIEILPKPSILYCLFVLGFTQIIISVERLTDRY